MDPDVRPEPFLDPGPSPLKAVPRRTLGKAVLQFPASLYPIDKRLEANARRLASICAGAKTFARDGTRPLNISWWPAAFGCAKSWLRPSFQSPVPSSTAVSMGRIGTLNASKRRFVSFSASCQSATKVAFADHGDGTDRDGEAHELPEACDERIAQLPLYGLTQRRS